MRGRRWFAGVGLVTLVPGLVTAVAVRQSVADATEPRASSAARVECEAPRTLHLDRFEDGSAHLRCARRVIVRVSVPD